MMNRPILTLRISRRAIGAAVLKDEDLILADGRHLMSRRDRASLAAARYVERLLKLSKAGGVVLDAPHPDMARSDRLVSAVESVLQSRQIASVVIGRADVLLAYGVRSLANRAAVRDIATSFWPQLTQLGGRAQAYVADAAAAALYAESRLALNPAPT